MNRMQVSKENIRKGVVQVAREEFLEKGYKDTSMRTIAALSGITLSNIYNYFKDKDEIFRMALAPLLRAIDQLLLKHNSENHMTLDVFEMNSYMQTTIDDFMLIIKNYRRDLSLLLFRADGSSLESFKERFIDRQTQMSIDYMNTMQKKFPQINCNVSKFFIHINCSWMMTAFCEIVSHDNLSDSDIERFLTEYFTFTTAGWKQLMKV